jgi:hypothetical protein
MVRMRPTHPLKCYHLPLGSFTSLLHSTSAENRFVARRCGGMGAGRSMLPFKALPKQVFEVNEKLDADTNTRVQLNAVVSLDRWFPRQR